MASVTVDQLFSIIGQKQVELEMLTAENEILRRDNVRLRATEDQPSDEAPQEG